MTAFVDDKDPQEARQADGQAAGVAGVHLLLRQQVGRHAARQAAATSRDRAQGTFAFHDWIREGDRRATSRTTSSPATSSPPPATRSTNPPTVWYKELQKPEQFVDDTAQVFLGLRLACAQCHHHPYEKWSQDDYWGIAAFFGRVGRKNVPVPGRRPEPAGAAAWSIFSRSAGNVTNKRTSKPADHEAARRRADESRSATTIRARSWWTGWSMPKNPFFARAVANRYWAHFFGRGIVDPLDDMRVTNPPRNPELLDALAKELVDNKYSLKHLIRTICKSRTYQLDADARTSSTSTTSRTTLATIRGA